MGKIYTLTIPTWIEGINTTVDIGNGCIHHVAFDGGMSRDRMYDVLLHGDFKGSVVNIITDSVSEFASSVSGGLGTTVIPYEASTVAKVVEVLSDMESRVGQRYDMLRKTNKKNIECYNAWAGKHNQMKPAVICWLHADKVLKQMRQEDIYEMLKNFLKVGRSVGVTLLLHSDEFNGIQKAVDSDVYAQFTLIHISPTTEHTKDMIVDVGNEVYHASIVPRDIM